MKAPVSWLREFVAIDDAERVAERLTAVGLETEWHAAPAVPDGVVTGRIVTCERHPNADRLSVCGVDVGDGRIRTIVCGAPNAAAGFVAAAALPGTDLGSGFVIAARSLRGVASEGMLCSERELGLSEDADGILLLPGDTPIGRPLAEVLPRDATLLAEPLSNRGDWMSIAGIAREIAAATGVEFRVPRPERETDASSGEWSVEIESADDCVRYAGLLVEGIAVGPSPEWIRQRLTAAGVRPISNVVDATNYVLLELGHPLHAFDVDRLSGTRVGVRRARAGETLLTLDGKPRSLSPDVLAITDASGPIALGGIMGGEPTRVTDGTTRILLEGAAFSARCVRAGRRHLKLITDASARFERGVNPETVRDALVRCVALLRETCEARIVHAIDSYPRPIEPGRVTLRARTLERILGVDLDRAVTRSILERLGMSVVSETLSGWEVLVPSHRRDLEAEEDLVEEVGRIHGYDRLPERSGARLVGTAGDAPRARRFATARELLLAQGLTEVVTPSLIDSGVDDPLGAGASFFGRSVPLRNPLTADRNALRGMLVPSLLAVLRTNVARSNRDVAIFEVGRTYSANAGGSVDETPRAAVLLAGRGRVPSTNVGDNSCDFFDIKGLLEVYVEQFWGTSLAVEDAREAPLDETMSAGILVVDRLIGYWGAIGTAARAAFDLPKELPVFVAEWNLETVPVVPATRRFEPLPRFPGVVRDLAFVVDRKRRHRDLAEALRAEGGDLLADVKLFDVYEGKPLDPEERSLAYTLVLRAPDRSLTSEEADECIDRIVKGVERRLGARIR